MEVAGGVVGASSPPRRVVVPVDESEESMHALSWCLSNVVSAARAAAAAPPAVVLFHARSPRPFYCPAVDGAGYLLTQQVMDSMDQYMASAADTVVTKAKSICTAFPGVRVETCVEKGDPRDVICGAAEKAGADMVVMGSHGYGFLQRALLGSVSNHCVQNCKCPVVVVKRPGGEHQAAPRI
ncbi:universal stress protein A-like protein [Panicum miliaceum]|uniref:Universal stress protein A-like protein n=1 Tax=Panicum miliaceum TaxID=4540 RepID=A0A3L6TMK2_PANMI|nr:universal stress protein A-like protein [Panicum miliaceum]